MGDATCLLGLAATPGLKVEKVDLQLLGLQTIGEDAVWLMPSKGAKMELEASRGRRECIPPMGVVLVSTLNGGVANLAPFGMFMPISGNPPMIALGVSPRRDTFKNIEEGGEFVVAVPGPEQVEVIRTSAIAYPPDVSEFEKAGVTPEASRVVRPYRVKECQTNLECKLVWMKEAGDHHVVVGEIVAAGVSDELDVSEWDRTRLRPVYFAGGDAYFGRGDLIDSLNR
jgi:flavin reductase (DIM6/NTAB) family NADH-FMN oxidoreductase RutF